MYDDFIPMFNGKKFDARAWIDLFHDAGAKYFVPTTKHHDGFALFDTEETSHRSSVHLAPGKRDYIGELFDAVDKSGYDLKKGTYYSMPEWFGEPYRKYGWQGFVRPRKSDVCYWLTTQRGGLAPDVYHEHKHEPYTGGLDIDDYIEDLQRPQMTILADRYKTDIMWCDVGACHWPKR